MAVSRFVTPCSHQCGLLICPCGLTCELALSEYWSDVGWGRSIISSQKDIPAASEGIRFHPQSPGAELYLQVELTEVLGPLCLLPSQFLHGGEVFEVFVVGDSVDGSCNNCSPRHRYYPQESDLGSAYRLAPQSPVPNSSEK